MHVLICPDKFKGTLTAREAADAIAAGWREIRPADELEEVPISDGGDGFGELLARQVGAEPQAVPTVDAAHRRVRASWWWHAGDRLALVESARVIGLAMLPRGRYHPFDLDTFGLGAVLRDVARRRPDACWVGIGGSATNDAGFGLARALGWKFLDRAGDHLTRWTDLDRLDRIRPPRARLNLGQLTVAVDVRNRLLGRDGATRIYGPQKGIRPQDVSVAERCFRRLVRRVNDGLGLSFQPSRVAGSGAAGGLGFGLVAFAGARVKSGFELFARAVRLPDQIRRTDLVITGEGAIDLTTVRMGKGVGQVARLCAARGKPCIGLAGRSEVGLAAGGFRDVQAIVPALAKAEDAMRRPAYWLTRLASCIARRFTEEPEAFLGS